MKITRATVKQSKRLFEIMVKAVEIGCATAYPPEIIKIWQKGRTPESMAEVISQKEIYYLRDKKIIRGFVHIGDAEICGLCVHSDYHRKGYGRKLFKFAVDKIGTRPVKVSSTLNAEPFYKKMGCRKTGTGLIRRHNRDIYVIHMELK